MKTLKNSSGYDASIKYCGGADEQAQAMRDAILNAPNTEDIYEIKGNKYYIKKDMGVEAIPENLQPGDAVLFERGGLWRVQCKEKLIIPEGVILVHSARVKNQNFMVRVITMLTAHFGKSTVKIFGKNIFPTETPAL